MSAATLLSSPAVVTICLCWITAWWLPHPLGRCLYGESAKSMTWELVYHTRLVRSSLHCFLCVMGGSMLMCQHLLSENGAAEAMVGSFSMQHQVLFAMSVGHWINAIWEDVATRQRLDQGAKELVPVLLSGYILHHLVTIFAYITILATGFLGGFPGTLGLLFEAPVLLMNERELAFATQPKPSWLRDSRQVGWHWCWTYIVFVIFRGGPSILYAASLISGNRLHSLLHETLQRPEQYALYHVLAIFFTLLNPKIMCLLVRWHGVDLAHLKLAPEDVASHTRILAWPGALGCGSSIGQAAIVLAAAAGCTLALGSQGTRDQGWQAQPHSLDLHLDPVAAVLCCCWVAIWSAGPCCCRALAPLASAIGPGTAPAKESQSPDPVPPSLANGEPARCADVDLEPPPGVSEIAALGASGVTDSPPSPPKLKGYRCRLRRQLVYNTVATCTGAYLLFPCLLEARDTGLYLPLNLLLDTSPVHRMAFTMGLGNFLVAIWEDLSSYSLLGHVFHDQKAGSCANCVMYSGYAAHHVVACFAFGFCICSDKLAGLCSIGLFFEAPFVLATYRELALASDEPPRWLRSLPRGWGLWLAIAALFVIARVGASGLYFYSITNEQWFTQLKMLDRTSFNVFYVLGIFFTALNVAMLCLFLPWCAQDVKQCGETSACGVP